MRRRRLLACAAALVVPLVSGCNVGPRYVRPTVRSPAAFKEGAPEAYNSLPPGTWQPARPQDAMLKGPWWRVFNEPELDALEARLEVDNQTIAQSFQSFMAARAQVNEARAGYYPTLTVNPSVNHSVGGAVGAGAAISGGGATGAPVTTGGVTNFYALPLEASWAPDLWDRVRNSVRQYQYAAQVSAADLENTRLTEQAALAVYYFELRGQDSLQDLYDRTVAADKEALELTRAQSETGVGTEEAVAQAEVTLENAEATGIGVATNRALYEHAMAMLIGQPASSFAMPVRVLETPVPPIPIGVPSRLLQRRPDVAAAERTMAQANALIGVEMAAYYPSLTLTGSGGLESSALGTLFSLPALFWSLGASASETIFDGGLRDATVAQYKALYKADVAAYRQTVLVAIQQVEDYVATLRILSRQIARQEVATRSARRYLDLATDRFKTGLDPYLNVITAQTTLLGDQQTLVTLRVSEMTAAVQLVQALGGGWDVSELP
ncbi:MAG TPA: efflux transporter outer membrane subunit [Polyangiaceae bacterium]|jgi:NodT family efflux transporter outer membrane factor (OMF) lipoprotein